MSILDIQWIQKDGTPIAVSEMENHHVWNSLNMQRRKKDTYIFNNPKEGMAKCQYWIDVFESEIERRKQIYAEITRNES